MNGKGFKYSNKRIMAAGLADNMGTDADVWETALMLALHEIEEQVREGNKKQDTKCHKYNYCPLITSCDDEVLRDTLDQSTMSPIIVNQQQQTKGTGDNYAHRRRRAGVVEMGGGGGSGGGGGGGGGGGRMRKMGVAERNETEREVVYKTLRNFIKITRLRSYNMF